MWLTAAAQRCPHSRATQNGIPQEAAEEAEEPHRVSSNPRRLHTAAKNEAAIPNRRMIMY